MAVFSLLFGKYNYCKNILLNNNMLVMIRHCKEKYFKGDFLPTPVGKYTSPELERHLIVYNAG